MLIKFIRGDILYLDSPYNFKQYGSNYHILNTIAKYDTFVPVGKTCLPSYQRSNYCKKGKY
ncbi:DNA adenine methylase [Aquimarina sp. 433]